MKDKRNEDIKANQLVIFTLNQLTENAKTTEIIMETSFNEMRTILDQRQAILLQELQDLKDQANKELQIQK